MKAIKSTPPALAPTRVKIDFPPRISGQRERPAAATTSTIALMKIVSRIRAIRRSPSLAATGPVDVVARFTPERGLLDWGERSTRSDDGSFLPQTKHSTCPSSFFTPQAGQYIRSRPAEP